VKVILKGALSLLLVVASLGYCQESEQPVRLSIKSDKQVHEIGEDIEFMLTIRNFTSYPWNIFDGVNSSKIVIDGKEYSSRRNFPQTWGGTSTLFPGSEISVALSLSAKGGYYDISEAVLAVGEHNIAVKMNKSISNTITIKVVGKLNTTP